MPNRQLGEHVMLIRWVARAALSFANRRANAMKVLLIVILLAAATFAGTAGPGSAAKDKQSYTIALASQTSGTATFAVTRTLLDPDPTPWVIVKCYDGGGAQTSQDAAPVLWPTFDSFEGSTWAMNTSGTSCSAYVVAPVSPAKVVSNTVVFSP